MPEECNVGCIGRDLTQMLDDARRSLSNRIPQLTAAVVTVDALAQRVALGDINLGRRPDVVSQKSDPQWCAVDFRQRLAALKSELRVQAQGSVVVRGLH